jgi:hypothetical protein
MLEKYKKSYGLRKMIKEYNSFKRTTIACNLTDAKTIGITWNIATDYFDTIKDFVSELKGQNKKVIVLGYIDNKENNGIEMQLPEFIFFNKKDLNWYYKPIGENAVNFIKSTFDILIDFDFENTLPIEYAVAKSNAKFKVGKNEGNSPNLYDLSLVISNESKNILPYFIEQLKKYLNMVKTK